MRVNVINLTMPKTRSVGFMSNATAFKSNTPLQKFDMILPGVISGKDKEKCELETKELGLGRLRNLPGISTARGENTYYFDSDRKIFCLPQELCETADKLPKTLGITYTRDANGSVDYFRTTTKEGTKLVSELLFRCHEATRQLVAQGKELLARSMRGV